MQNDSLQTLIDQFISYKKQNGYAYQSGVYYLKKYALSVLEMETAVIVPTKESAEIFLGKYENAPGSLYNAAAFLREFSRYLIARGYSEAYLIPSGRIHLPTPVQPYFFTEEEITAFFSECDKVMDNPHYKGRHIVLPAMFRLLYCCGLRCMLLSFQLPRMARQPQLPFWLHS